MFLRDEYDELSLRERDAARALKSALLGWFLCPLQLYTAWLLLLVVIAEEQLRPRYFWYVVGAATALVFQVSMVTTLLVLLESL
jgi:hypothetical protein